jgi:hypothetical protein
MNKESPLCFTKSASCPFWDKLTIYIVDIINHHYFDLQMYANFVYDIETNEENKNKKLSNKYNFIEQIKSVSHDKNIDFHTLSSGRLTKIIREIIPYLQPITLTKEAYLSNVVMNETKIFGTGEASATVLFKMTKKLENGLQVPLITKLSPINYPHHNVQIDEKFFINDFIESPNLALYLKEAWMYCFTKNHLRKYVHTFACIGDCYLIKGFPVKDKNNLLELINEYQQRGKQIKFKRWFNTMLENNQVSNIILNDTVYGCFEMQIIDGTMTQLIFNRKMSVEFLFEYLYTKLVCGVIGNIIFTDDHSDNIAFIKINWCRNYEIISKGKTYNFYINDEHMVQFIDLERYVFNYTPKKLYTNTGLKKVPIETINNILTPQIKLNRVNEVSNFLDFKKSYDNNNYIFDKGLWSLNTLYLELKKSVNLNNNEVEIWNNILNIVNNSLIHEVDNFAEFMSKSVPDSMLRPPSNKEIVKYSINLDNVNSVINSNDVFIDTLVE